MVEHKLKCWPNYFDALKSGDKTFEVRKDDRGFQKGDILVLMRTEPDRLWSIEYTIQGKPKHELRKRVKWILTGGQFGVEAGHVVMALEDVA